MRKSILTVLLCSFVLLPLSAQNQPDINDLLTRLNENHFGSVSDVFTPEELDVLKTHFYGAENTIQTESILINRRGASTQSVSPVDVVKVLPDDLSLIESLGPTTIPDFEGAGIALTQVNTNVIVANSNRIYIRGINSNVSQDTGISVNVAPNEAIVGLERLSNGDVFAIGTDGISSSHLYRLDPMTWGTTMIGGNNGLTLPLCLGRTATDELVVLDGDDDNIYGVDALTGVVNLKGPAGFDANFGQGMAYDPVSDMILLTAFNNSTFDSELRSLNPVTGATALIGTITPGDLDQFGYVDWYDQDLLGDSAEVFDSFQFYPNPASETLHLSSQAAIERISVVDITGKQIMNQQIDALNAEINISALSNGLYILNVEIDGRSASYKFVKD